MLKKMNQIRIQDRPIYDFYSYHGYSLWSFYQQILWEEIQRFHADDGRTKKRKKNYAFAPLKDLIQKIFILGISLVSFIIFLIKRPRVIVFSNDIVQGPFRTDLRINELYRFLNERNISYGEIIHTVFNRGIINRFLARRRPIFYLENADIVFSLTSRFKRKFFADIKLNQINWSDFSEKERSFAQGILKLFSKRAEISILKIKLFKWFFKILKPEFLFAIDDVRYYHELLLAAKLAGVKTCGFQHGRFNQYLVGWINYQIPPQKCLIPDSYFVWNEYWQNKIISLSPTFSYYQDRIRIAGKPGSIDQSQNIIHRTDDGIMAVLIPHEVKAVKYEINAYVEKFLACPKTKVLYRLRQDIPEEEQKKSVAQFLNHSDFKIVGPMTDSELRTVDVITGTYSTMLYEMVEKGIPIAVLESSTTEADDLVDEGMATKITLDSEICKMMKKISETKENVLKKSAEKFHTKADIKDTLSSIL